MSSIVTTESVVAFFGGRAANLDEEGKALLGGTLVPAAWSSFAKNSIFGDLHEPVAITDDSWLDSNKYFWYDLGKLQDGQMVGRVSRQGTRHTFTRIGPNSWHYVRQENDELSQVAG